jgi:hypothetical protein
MEFPKKVAMKTPTPMMAAARMAYSRKDSARAVRARAGRTVTTRAMRAADITIARFRTASIAVVNVFIGVSP